MTQQYSPDVLALNPDIAKQVKSSRTRTRKAGYLGSLNIQDFSPVVKNTAERLEMVRCAAAHFTAMLDTWGTGTKVQRAAQAAAELVILEATE